MQSSERLDEIVLHLSLAEVFRSYLVEHWEMLNEKGDSALLGCRINKFSIQDDFSKHQISFQGNWP
jgi:hypothetical protein